MSENYLQDLFDDMAAYIAVLSELKKLDTDTLDYFRQRMHKPSLKERLLQIIYAVEEFKDAAQETREKIDKQQQQVRFCRAEQEKYESNEYERSV